MSKKGMNLPKECYVSDDGHSTLWTFVGDRLGVKVYCNGSGEYDREAASIGVDGWSVTCDIKKARVWDGRVTYSFNLYGVLGNWIGGTETVKVIILDESFRPQCEDNGIIEYRYNKKLAQKEWLKNAEDLRKKYA